MDQHKKLMDEFLQKLTKSKTSPVLSDEKYNIVIKTLQYPELCTDYNLKHWVEKRKRFQLMDLPGLGICDALVVPAKEKNIGSSSSAFLRVVPESKVYDIVKDVHNRELNHAGYKKCLDYVSILIIIL